MREIALHGKYGEGKFTLVDDEDFEALNKYKWTAYTNGTNFYAVRSEKKPNGKWTSVSMHRQLMDVTDPKIEVDHRNRKSLDNQKGNLRKCTRTQNGYNNAPKKDPSSIYMGVKKISPDKWLSRITTKSKTTMLGYFDTEEEAAMVRDKEAFKRRGEFAALNFPERFNVRQEALSLPVNLSGRQ